MTRIILHGCSGHMGHVVAEIAAQDPDLSIVAGLDAVDDDTRPFPVYIDKKDCTEEADAVVDFSTAKAVDSLLDYCVERKLPLVLCTTGLTEEQLAKVREASGEIAILRSANMSLGINTILKLTAEAAKVLYPAGFDIEVEEMHHRRKLDAPSGTALLLADGIRGALDEEVDYVYDRSARSMARPKAEIGISSLRGGTVVGEHEVVFAGQDEVIRISHSAFSRAIFAKGAAAAAKFLAGKPAGLYTMSDVIG
ncbi:MAG: 4-hydroxy-tetrahydrodipicolinate reductase [Lachnospiraceae bacterium]|nr:4-hydroxy-tetrahydrodipicolinate reductase [Lachnospiraceae bacterium]